MSNYLVSGATGYVGQEVIRHLIAGGHKVVAISRRSPPLNVQHICKDITKTLKDIQLGIPIDYILHLASLPGDTGNPEEMLNVNAMGCLNVLEWARVLNVKHIVVASSISAYEWYPATKYSPPDYLPIDEMHPCRPKDMYSVTKRIQELLCQTYYYQYNVPVTCLRLTAVIGPDGQGGGRSWRIIAQELSEGETVRIPHFSKEEICHYVDIRDVARMLIAASQSEATIGEIFNCCGPKAVSGEQFEKVITDIFPNKKVVYGYPWSMAQGGHIEFSMEKAKKLFGFEPNYDVHSSILYIKEWIDNGGLRQNISREEAFANGIENLTCPPILVPVSELVEI